MGVSFISKVLELFGQIFMKFWNLPMADLGFNLGTFIFFIVLIKFAMSVFLNIDIQPVSTSGTVKFLNQSNSTDEFYISFIIWLFDWY